MVPNWFSEIHGITGFTSACSWEFCAQAGYEFQSGGVISLLENLEDQFKEETGTEVFG